MANIISASDLVSEVLLGSQPMHDGWDPDGAFKMSEWLLKEHPDVSWKEILDQISGHDSAGAWDDGVSRLVEAYAASSPKHCLLELVQHLNPKNVETVLEGVAYGLSRIPKQEVQEVQGVDEFVRKTQTVMQDQPAMHQNLQCIIGMCSHKG